MAAYIEHHMRMWVATGGTAMRDDTSLHCNWTRSNVTDWREIMDADELTINPIDATDLIPSGSSGKGTTLYRQVG